MAKKTNYVSYELERLNKYVAQLLEYLDANPPHLMVDRIEVLQSTRGNPIIKVISSKEQQLKCWSDRMRELPTIVETLNKLRALVEDDDRSKEVVKRGGGNLPGLFSHRLLKNGEEDNKENISEIEIEPETPASTDTEDDDSGWDEWED